MPNNAQNDDPLPFPSSPGEDDEDEDSATAHSARESVGAMRTVFRFLKPYYAGYGHKLRLVFLCVLAETGYNVAFPLSLKYLIDNALLKEDEHALVLILTVLGTLAVTISAVAVLIEYLNSWLAASIVRDLRARLFAHLQSLPLSFYARARGGEAMSRFSTDLTEVHGAVRGWMSMGLAPALELVTATALMFYLNRPLALAAMLIWPLTLIGPRILSPRAVAATYEKKQHEAGLLSIVQENISAQPLVKAYGLRGVAQKWFQQRNRSLADASTRVNFLTAMVERSVNTAVVILHVLILGFGAWLAFHKRTTIGTLITFEDVFWDLSYNIGYVSQFVPELAQAAGSIRHIHELLDEKPAPGDEPDAITLPRLQREIAIDNISFSYGNAEPLFANLSLRIPCGARIAITGPSGSGKSTLLGLILRLHEPSSGVVRIDGYDIRSVTRESLLAQAGIVFQDSFLFNTTIRENIRLGKPGGTDEEVEAAARVAEIDDFIRRLPRGYDTMAGERGGAMSGGERQRIAIARAIIRDPAILILDEATSALDHVTEVAILGTLRRIASGRTVIFATHRLESVADFDTAFVLNRGGSVDTVSPQELPKRS